jgi:hypothetical protein
MEQNNFAIKNQIPDMGYIWYVVLSKNVLFPST